MLPNGLPKVLETMLEAMIEQHTVSSWNIAGGNKFTNITIRFHTGVMTEVNNSEVVKYKRISKHQMDRDKLRSDRWKGHLSHSETLDQGHTESALDTQNTANSQNNIAPRQPHT